MEPLRYYQGSAPNMPMGAPYPQGVPIGFIEPVAPSFLGALGSVAAPLIAFGATFFSFAGEAGDANELAALQGARLASGIKDKIIQAPYTPPFTGGQSVGVLYDFTIEVRTNIGTGGGIVYEGTRQNSLRGAIKSIRINRVINGAYEKHIIQVLSDEYPNGKNVGETNGWYRPNEQNQTQATFISISRRDGLPDTGGNLPNPNPSISYPSEGYNPDNRKAFSDAQREAKENKKSGFPVIPFDPYISNLNLEKGSTKENKSPFPVIKNPVKNPSPTPSPSPLQTPSVPTGTPKKEDKNPFNPIIQKDDTASKLTAIVGSIAALKIISDQIVNQTLPTEQVKNAATGSCQSLNSDSCTNGLANKIKNPINDKLDQKFDANTVATTSILGNQATQNTTLASIIGFVSRIYNNQFIHSSLSLLTTFTTLHNAAMLSRDIGETLGETVDNGLKLVGLKLKNKDGDDQDFTEFIGQNVRATIASIIGAENYAQLTLKWQKASAILNSAANVLNTTQSLIDPLSSAIEYGMENVSRIGNNLQKDGVVSENAYPRMDETIRARHSNRFARFGDTLEGAENITSNLSSVTSDAVSMKEDWKQLREDKKALTDSASAFNTNDRAALDAIKASIPEQSDISLKPAPDD